MDLVRCFHLHTFYRFIGILYAITYFNFFRFYKLNWHWYYLKINVQYLFYRFQQLTQKSHLILWQISNFHSLLFRLSPESAWRESARNNPSLKVWKTTIWPNIIQRLGMHAMVGYQISKLNFWFSGKQQGEHQTFVSYYDKI